MKNWLNMKMFCDGLNSRDSDSEQSFWMVGVRMTLSP